MRDSRLARFNRAKRVIDLMLLVVTAPVTVPLALLTAAAVAASMGRPVIYRQARLGWNDEEFTVLKFRTMNDKRDRAGRLLPDRERLTRTGRLLRKLSLDELPQLINVARGDMSLVGPRPLFPRYLPYYTPEERRRHDVRPGITGLAQVSGRNSVLWEQRLALDCEYARRASLRLDARIIARTVRQVVASEGVSVIAGDSGAPLDIDRAFPRGRRVQLHPFAEDDIPSRVAWMSHPHTRRHMQLPEGVTVATTTAWHRTARRDPARIDFTAWDPERARRVGMAGLKRTNDGAGEFYVFTAPDEAGRGYGGEISELVLRWALESGRYERVCLTVDRDNEAAVRIYQRLGFAVTRETTGRIWMEVDGRV